MFLKEIEIEGFGRFLGERIFLEPGLNVLYGPNESGKTTLHAFLTGMFFGLRRMRGRAARKDAYSRYEPWEDALRYGGSIRFSCGGKDFCLRRRFPKERARTSLVCETDGEQLCVEDGDLAMLLGNISESVFTNTVSIGQLAAATGEELAAELENYMANCQDGGVGDLDIQRALDALRKKRRELQKAKEEKEALWQDGLRRHQEEIAFWTQEKERLEEQIKEGEALEEQSAPKEEEKAFPTGLLVGGMALLGTLLLAALLVAPGPWKLLTLVVAAGEGGLFWYLQKAREALKRQKARQEAYWQEEEKRKWARERLTEELAEKSLLLENLQKECEEYEESPAVPEELLVEMAGITLAIETIEEISGQVRSRLGTGLRERTSAVFAALTEGKYSQVDVRDGTNMGVLDDGRYVPLEQLSRGTIEQVYFSLRMAAADILCGEEEMPILLDDAFAMYDDRRLRQTLRWLAQKKRQVLLFTCQRREIEMLREMGIPFWEIQLPQSL